MKLRIVPVWVLLTFVVGIQGAKSSGGVFGRAGSPYRSRDDRPAAPKMAEARSAWCLWLWVCVGGGSSGRMAV